MIANLIYYTIGTQKRAIIPIDENKYPALLHSLRPGSAGFLNRLLAMLFPWKMDQINYFVLKYWRRRGRNISKFWVTSLFQHRFSARAGKQQFQWRKRIANFTSKKCKWQQFISRNEIWPGSRRQGKMTSTDLRRTINAPTWTDFHLFLQRELTTNVYKTKRSSTEWFILSKFMKNYDQKVLYNHVISN